MGFLAPWFLGGLAALGLPVYIHLLRQHTAARRMPFSSLMFFERRTQSSIKHRRLQYLLLFALRCAVYFSAGPRLRAPVRAIVRRRRHDLRQARGDRAR